MYDNKNYHDGIKFTFFANIKLFYLSSNYSSCFSSFNKGLLYSFKIFVELIVF